MVSMRSQRVIRLSRPFGTEPKAFRKTISSRNSKPQHFPGSFSWSNG